jgi:hypothetical protein
MRWKFILFLLLPLSPMHFFSIPAAPSAMFKRGVDIPVRHWFFFDTPSDPKKAAIRFRMTHRLFSFAWRFV